MNMKLELCNFEVRETSFGDSTSWKDGRLEINHDELVRILKDDPSVADVEVELARPGESVRIVNQIDVIEPRVKVQGDGVVYPGVHRRHGALVGSGRTHRLGGLAVTVLAPPHTMMGYSTGLDRPNRTPGLQSNWIDMVGNDVDNPYAALNHVCVIVHPNPGLSADEAMSVVQLAQLKTQDYLGETTRHLDPPETEVFDMSPRPDLRGVVYNNCILSPEAQNANPTSARGAALYGVTRLTQPWFMSPTEILDGAVFGNAGGVFPTWPLTNTVVLEMCRQHGTEFNFLGAIMVRTMWEEQWQKELMGHHAAFMATSVGAEGAVISPNWRGQRFLDTILVLQACERAGIKTVMLTEEEDNEDGSAPPLLTSAPEVRAVVSTGTGTAIVPFPPVERVIGASDDLTKWYGEKDPPHGRYGVSHTNDVYGFSKLTAVEY